MLQAARADAVRSLLIFLHLLERDAERLAQRRLAHAEHHAAHAHPAAHVLVDWVEGLFGHLPCPSAPATEKVLRLLSPDARSPLLASPPPQVAQTVCESLATHRWKPG